MWRKNPWRHALWVASLAAWAASGPYTIAQQAPAADQQPGADEIIVTARKREETLISVPLAVTAVTAEQIEREGIKDVEDIMGGDPSLDFDLGFAAYDTRIVIRGLSPTRGRPNVATLVDGIDVSSEAIGVAGGSLLINPRLIDVQQIEIVKGPQSALYGRSAFAGAVSYTTLDPGEELEGSASIDLNNRDQSEIKAGISFPLGDTLGLRLNGYSFSDDGFYRNLASGARVGGGDGRGGSLTLKWQPADSYSLKFRTEYSDDAFNATPQAVIAFNTTNAVPAVASICNVGTNALGAATPVGFIIDANCPLTPAVLALGLNAYRELNRLSNTTAFDDMLIPAYRGALGDLSDQGIAGSSFTPDFTRSTDNGLTAPDFPGSNRQVLRLSAVQKFDTGAGTFSSLTGYTRALVSVDYDSDRTSFLPIQQNLKTDGTTEQFSQELRFTSDFDFPVNFIVGLQYWTERADQLERNNTVFAEGTICFAVDPFGPAPAAQAAPGTAFRPFPGGPPIVVAGAGSCTPPTGGFTSISAAPFMDNVAAARQPSWIRRLVDHSSAYLDIEWQIAESFKFIAEARYVDEDNVVSAGFTNGVSGPGTVTLCGSALPCSVTPMNFVGGVTTAQTTAPTLNDSYVTPKGTLQWTPNENLNVYASFAKAQKPGGYSTTGLGGTGAPVNYDDIKFLPEKLNVYEFGAKWRSADRRLQLNGTLFKTDFTDKQVGTQILIGNIISNRVTNAGAAVIEGLEFGAQWRASANWTLGAGATYFGKYEFTDYKTTSTGAGEIARLGSCVVGYLDATGFVALGSSPIPIIPGTTTQRPLTCQLDRTGKLIEDTPELAIAVNVGYRRPFGASGNSLFVDLDGNWEDERFLEDDNSAYLSSYWVANLRVGVESERWSFTAYVDNLSDDRTIKSAGTGPAIYASDFRLGAFNYSPAPVVTLARFVFAPSIPTTTFANLPNPRTMGLRLNYKF